VRSIIFLLFFVGALPTIAFNPFCGIILWSWLSFMSPHRLTYSTADLPVAIVVAVATIIAWLFSREPKRFPPDITLWLIIILMLSFSLTTLLSLVPDRAFDKWLTTCKALLFVLITAAMLTNRIRIHALIWIMAISISFYGLKSGVGSILTSGTATVYGPANTVIADNNHFAVALLVTVPLLNYLRMNSKMRIVQVGCSVMIALCVISVFASYSRGGLLGLFAMSAFLWLKSRAKIMPAVALGIALFTGFYFMPQRWIDRMNTIETYSEDESAQSRLGMWHAAMAIASQRPFGAGFMGPYNQGVVNDYYPGIQARAVHSIYFEVIGEHGYIVFFFWALVPLFAWRNGGWIIKYTRDRPDLKWAGDLARMIQVSLIGYCVGGTFLSLSYWDFYFTLVAVLAATRMLVATAVRPMTVPRLAIQREQHLQAPAHLPVTDQIQRS
jgi:probable O-glycosylation ligase (exosortase A-associated)